MAFDPDGLGVLAYCNGITIWHYLSKTDGASTIKANGFFSEAADMMKLGDLIVFQSSNDTSGMRRVALLTPTQVNTAALG
tara:strand:+ start:2186 stop:2425 length:240 start_codon:yes stop_codon:yes gene_type:complete